MLNTKLQNNMVQCIWELRNKMADELEKLEKLHSEVFPTVEDGSKALYTVYNTWNSDAYNDLAKLITEIKK